jgi:hypothetical protein
MTPDCRDLSIDETNDLPIYTGNPDDFGALAEIVGIIAI